MTTLSKDRRDDPYTYLVEVIRTLGPEEAFRSFLRIYPGVVIDVEDPDRLGRVRVMVPAFGQLEPGDVPSNLWARPAFPPGVFSPPYVGDIAHVWSPEARPESQVFLGTTRVDQPNPLSSTKATRRGFVTNAGHHLVMDDDPELLTMELVHGDGQGGGTGSKVSFSRDGDIRLERTQDGRLNQMIVSANGITAQVGESIASVTASQVRLEAGGCSITMSNGEVVISGATVRIDGTRVLLDGSQVSLGRGASEPAVKGATMSALFRAHSHATAGPGSPTVPGSAQPSPGPGNGLSSVVKVA